MIGKVIFFIIIVTSATLIITNIFEMIPDQAGQMAVEITRSTAPINELVQPAEEPATAGSEQELFITDLDSQWTPAELATVETVLAHTYRALDEAGLDGETILAGYRFQRVAGEHVDEQTGLVAVVNHENRIIRLADSAFLRLGGFYIYHELGHVVDRQSNRALSVAFHGQIANAAALEGTTSNWRTADGYWLRAHAYEDREEATADAFALWIGTGQAGMGRPIFAGQPLDADYQGIIEKVEAAIFSLGLSLR